MAESKMPARTPGPWRASQTYPLGDWCIHASGIPQQLAYLAASSTVDWPLEANAKFIVEACNQHEALKRRADLVEPLVEALRVAVDTLALTEREKTEDPQYGEYIRSIGDKIGYGALMCGAQAEWRKRLREDGDPVGGEFVAGPCYITVLDTLKILRSAIQAYEAAQ